MRAHVLFAQREQQIYEVKAFRLKYTPIAGRTTLLFVYFTR